MITMTIIIPFDTTAINCPHCGELLLDPAGFDSGDYRCCSCGETFTIKEE